MTTEKIPKIGDRFTLSELPDMVWKVDYVDKLSIKARSDMGRSIILWMQDGLSLNWLLPEVPKLSKEQAEKVKELVKFKMTRDGETLFEQAIDAMTE